MEPRYTRGSSRGGLFILRGVKIARIHLLAQTSCGPVIWASGDWTSQECPGLLQGKKSLLEGVIRAFGELASQLTFTYVCLLKLSFWSDKVACRQHDTMTRPSQSTCVRTDFRVALILQQLTVPSEKRKQRLISTKLLARKSHLTKDYAPRREHCVETGLDGCWSHKRARSRCHLWVFKRRG